MGEVVLDGRRHGCSPFKGSRLLYVRNSGLAVIMPKGRHALAGEEEAKHAKKKPPLGFLG